MIHIQNASLAYGSQVLFNNISLTLAQNQRIGVLGRNGTGKSTLLKIIAEQAHFDEGGITFDRHKKIAYMPQEMVILSLKSVFDEMMSVFEEQQALEKEKGELEALLQENSVEGDQAQLLVERYAALQEQCSFFDISQAQARAERILKGLGFSAAQYSMPISELSVGWKMRVVLAKLLLEQADFYLFDEPTNHLDLPAQEWFFQFLKEGKFGFLLVTHDRHYLERACDYILALERSKTLFFHGNLSDYIKMSEKAQEELHSAYARQQKEIARKQATIDRFRASASKAKMAQSMIKQLEKIERIEIEQVLPSISFTFPSTMRPGNNVLSLDGIAHSFEGRTLFKDANSIVQRGERVALVAPNGTGKTTLFNVITGKLAIQKGLVSFGTNVQYAVFEQDQLRALNPQHTVYEEILEAIPNVTEATIRTFLGCFLFSGDTIHKKISVLSGGERNRVAMVKVLLQKANLLLLDEPTNHLDLYAKDVLLQALKSYQGTIVFVSHDHNFLQSLATTIWELTPSGIHSYPGTYESYLDMKKVSERTEEHKPLVQNRAQEAQRTQKEQHALRKEIAAVESKIEKLERELEKLTHSFSRYEYGSADWEETSIKFTSTQKQLSELITLWESLLAKLN